MRNVKSAGFFEQMKGRGVRVISPDKLRTVTPCATSSTSRFAVLLNDGLTHPAGSSAAQQAAIRAQLAGLGLIVRFS